jgi:hypothetical protein
MIVGRRLPRGDLSSREALVTHAISRNNLEWFKRSV